MNPRVLFSSPFAIRLFEPEATRIFGGTEVRALTFARALAERGRYEVHFSVVHDARPPIQHGELRLHFDPGPRIDSLEAAYRRVRAALEDPHRLLESAPPTGDLPAALAHALGRQLPRRLLFPLRLHPYLVRLRPDVGCAFGVHGVTANVLYSLRRAGAKTVLFLAHDRDVDPMQSAERVRAARWCFRLVDVVVAQTQTQRAQLYALGRRDAVVIPNPIDLRDGDPPPPRAALPPRYILWIGRTDLDHKRPLLFWELARRLPDVAFVAVLNRNPGCAEDEEIRRQAPPNVTLVERASPEEADALYRRAVAFVSTSMREGFPNTFLQAAKHRVPIYSLEVDPDGALEEHGFGRAFRGSLDELEAEVRRAWDGAPEARRMGEAGRRYVERYHALDDQVDRLEALLRDLTRRARRRDTAGNDASTPGGERRSSSRDRLYPSRVDHAYWHLRRIREELEAIVSVHVKGRGRGLLIDYGCGAMPYRALFSPHVRRYVGADLPGNPEADVLLSPSGALPFEDGEADIVLSNQVLEHVRSPAGYLSECRRVLSPRGLLVLSTHGVWRYHPDPLDCWRWTASGLRQMLEEHGFEIVALRGIMGPASAGLQLVQDAVRPHLRGPLRPLFIAPMQVLIEATDRLTSPSVRDADASTFVVTARPA